MSNDIPPGYCHCGCGRKTKLAPYGHARIGWVKGEPLRYLHGHSGAGGTPKLPDYADQVQEGDVWRLPVKNHQGGTVHALVDADDWPVVGKLRWRLDRCGYPRCCRHRTLIPLHRILMGLELGDGKQVDHINRDKLDNRRANLRLVDHMMNARNVVHPLGKSGVRGVAWNKRTQRWQVQVTRPEGNGLVYLGCFTDLDEAAKVARKYRAEHLPWVAENGLPS